MKLGDVENAVKAASPRVVGFGEPTDKVTNGLGSALVMAPDLDSTDPVSTEELDAIVRAIWENCPFEPNAIRLAARDAATGDTAVDLRSPAEALKPMNEGPFGDQGVTLTLMSKRYGDWEKPE